MNNKVEICQKAAGRAAQKLQINFSKAKNNCLKYAKAGLLVFAVMGLPFLLSQAANAQGHAVSVDTNF